MSFARVLHLAMSSCALHHHVFKTCISPGLPVPSAVRSEPRHTCTRPRHVRNIILSVAGKCSRNGLKIGVRCCFVVNRPPVKFHRIRRSFDAPTDNYSGSIASLTSDVFGLRKPCRAASLPSSLRPTRSSQSARPNLTSLVSPRPSSRATESCSGPDPECRHRCIRIISKHLQNITVLLFGLPSLFFLNRPILIR